MGTCGGMWGTRGHGGHMEGHGECGGHVEGHRGHVEGHEDMRDTWRDMGDVGDTWRRMEDTWTLGWEETRTWGTHGHGGRTEGHRDVGGHVGDAEGHGGHPTMGLHPLQHKPPEGVSPEVLITGDTELFPPTGGPERPRALGPDVKMRGMNAVWFHTSTSPLVSRPLLRSDPRVPGFLGSPTSTCAFSREVGVGTASADAGRAADIIYVDLRKAFDAVPRDVLVSKLEGRGFDRRATRWGTGSMDALKELQSTARCPGGDQ